MFKKPLKPDILSSLINVFRGSISEQQIKEMIGTLQIEFPDITEGKIERLIQRFLEVLKESRKQSENYDLDKKQQADIQNYVASVIEKIFELSYPIAEGIAFNLLDDHDTFLPDAENRRAVISPTELNRIRDNIIGIDVIYKHIPAISQWERITRVFVRTADMNQEHSQTVRLLWDSVPYDVKQVFLEKKAQEQRFVLFPLGKEK